ncbi:hypothetical protein BGZ59_011047, partial [Podila verticillata]
MAHPEHINPPALQKFRSEEGKLLTSLQGHVCPETEIQYLHWSDIQLAFPRILHLEYSNGVRVLYSINDDGEL